MEEAQLCFLITCLRPRPPWILSSQEKLGDSETGTSSPHTNVLPHPPLSSTVLHCPPLPSSPHPHPSCCCCLLLSSKCLSFQTGTERSELCRTTTASDHFKHGDRHEPGSVSLLHFDLFSLNELWDISSSVSSLDFISSWFLCVISGGK